MDAIRPTLDLYTILLLIGLAQGIFLTYFFFINRKRNSANLILGCLILVLTLSLIEIFLNYTGFILSVIPLYNFSEPLQFLLGPLFYFYIRIYAGQNLPRPIWIHFLPFVLYLLYMTIEFSMPAAQKYNSYLDVYHPEQALLPLSSYRDHDPLNIKPVVTGIIILLHLAGYFILSVVVLWSQISEKLHAIFRKNNDSKQYRWLIQFLFIVIIGILLFPISKFSFKVAVGENLMGVYITFFIYLIGYSIIRHSPFFRERTEKKYHTSTLSEEWMDQKMDQLKTVMVEEKPFIKNSFSRSDLAERLSISDHQLSQVINERTDTNFFGMVNQYRTWEAKKMLDDPDNDHLKIEQIAYDVGYNSKSAFYAAFKKEFNCTPHAYRKSK